MTNRSDVWNLLLARKGEWVPRADIQFVGGESWDRRLREVQEDVVKAGNLRLERKAEGNTVTHVRLVALEERHGRDSSQRYNWECVTCLNSPLRMSETQPSMDPRWRLGVCWYCDKKGKRQATFRLRS